LPFTPPSGKVTHSKGRGRPINPQAHQPKRPGRACSTLDYTPAARCITLRRCIKHKGEERK
jgi:hypothetical protein